jgi:HNH endonuclease
MVASWEEYLSITTEAEIMSWCRSKAYSANSPRLYDVFVYGEERLTPGEAVLKGYSMPDDGEIAHRRILPKLTGDVVREVLFAARGRCCYCGTLCLERRKAHWKGDSRKQIGSLEHIIRAEDGGTNDRKNLAWACLACNTSRDSEFGYWTCIQILTATYYANLPLSLPLLSVRNGLGFDGAAL